MQCLYYLISEYVHHTKRNAMPINSHSALAHSPDVLEIINLLGFLWICSFWTCHVKGITQYVASVSCYCCLDTKLCLTLCDPRNCSMLGFPILHYLPEFSQIHVHWVSDINQPSRLLSFSSPPVLSLSQHQGLFQGVDFSYQMAKVLELQRQSFQWIFKVYFL